MPIKTVAEFKVMHMQILDETGKADASLEPKLTPDQLKEMYRLMVLARAYDRKCMKLQRQGRMYTYIPVEGQEACQIGSIAALQKEDWMVPAFRETAAYIAKGIPLKTLCLYWMGNERGNSAPKDVNAFPVSIPVGSQMLHAVGIGWAAKLKGHKTLAITYFGDGATSEGDFYEAINFAGVFKTNTIFLCQNNGWAISVPRSKQTVAQTLAQKGIAAGITFLQVDGMDVLAVYKATLDAADRARRGEGPTLIECLTYRLGPHSTSDDPSKYRKAEETAEWQKKDPVERFKLYLRGKGIWTEEWEAKLQADSDAAIDAAVKDAEADNTPNLEDMFKYVYAQMPDSLKEQMEELKQTVEEKKNSE
ncbi:MAG: pyruvate dehydrogenase (acetyl-transferring) E1 component subunit alpha [Candidatus Micrarchaeota archaeon]|mgnify:CR=1 FL=1